MSAVINNCVHLVYWFTSRFTEDVKLCCDWKYIKENKQSDFVSNSLIMSIFLLMICMEPDNIVVTKSFSEYCNAAPSIVHELHTALFQCFSPLFPLGITKLQIILGL